MALPPAWKISFTIVIFFISLCISYVHLSNALPLEASEQQFLSDLVSQTAPRNLPSNWNISTIPSACDIPWSGILCTNVTTYSRITQIELDNFYLPGTIPRSIANIILADTIILASLGMVGTIPDVFGTLTNLVELNLESNFLNGTIPTSIWALNTLQILNLNLNYLNDQLPNFGANLITLTQLTIHGNNLTGTIPDSFSNLLSLTVLDLAFNDLSGTIPPQLFSLPFIFSIDLSDNLLIGDIPSLANSDMLVLLDLSSNSLNGTIPGDLGQAYNLITFYIGDNNITGTIPPTITNMTELSIFSARQNHIFGTIPSEIGNMINLTIWDLSYNNITGTIPNAVGNLTSITIFAMVANSLTGTIPDSYCDMTLMTYFNLGSNSLTGTIPDCIGNLSSIFSFYLDGNNLYGTIPPSIGNLTQCLAFVVDNNNLTGPIPIETGNMTNLQYLLLSGNNLSNDVPYTLGNLHQLTSLDLSNNQLQGNFPYAINVIPTLTSLQIYNNFLDCPLGTLAAMPVLATCDVSDNWMCGHETDSILTPTCIPYFPSACKITSCRKKTAPLPVTSTGSVQISNPSISGASITMNSNYPSANIVMRDARTKKTSNIQIDLVSFNENIMSSIGSISSYNARVLNSLDPTQLPWVVTQSSINTPNNPIAPIWYYTANVTAINGVIKVTFVYLPLADSIYSFNATESLSNGSLRITVEADNWNLITRPPLNYTWAASTVFHVSSSENILVSNPSSGSFPGIYDIYPISLASSGMPGTIQSLAVGQSGIPGTLNPNVRLVFNTSNDQKAANAGSGSFYMTSFFVMPSLSNVTFSYDTYFDVKATPVPPPKPQLLGNTIGAGFLIAILIIMFLTIVFIVVMWRMPRWRRAVLPCLGRAADPVEYL